MADAGPDQTVFVTDTVQLDGSGSSDVDGDPLTFQWSLISVPGGSAAVVSDPTLVKLNTALMALGDENENNDAAAIGILGAFINSLGALTGTQIDAEDAADLIADTQTIIDLITGL